MSMVTMISMLFHLFGRGGGLLVLWLLFPDSTPIKWPYRIWLSPNWEVSIEHLRRVWLASRERLPFRTPGSVPVCGRANAPIVETSFTELVISFLDFSPWIPLGTFSSLLSIVLWLSVPIWWLILLWKWGFCLTSESYHFLIPLTLGNFSTLLVCHFCWLLIDDIDGYHDQNDNHRDMTSYENEFLCYFCPLWIWFCTPPPTHLRQCIAVADGWLLVDIGWFVLFLWEETCGSLCPKKALI